MPTPKNKRIVVLQSSYSATNVIANLNLTMNANFTTPGNVTTVNLLDRLRRRDGALAAEAATLRRQAVPDVPDAPVAAPVVPGAEG